MQPEWECQEYPWGGFEVLVQIFVSPERRLRVSYMLPDIELAQDAGTMSHVLHRLQKQIEEAFAKFMLYGVEP